MVEYAGTPRQPYIDALNRHVRLNDLYNKGLDQMSEPGGLSRASGFVQLADLQAELEEARLDYEAKTQAWMAAGCP